MHYLINANSFFETIKISKQTLASQINYPKRLTRASKMEWHINCWQSHADDASDVSVTNRLPLNQKSLSTYCTPNLEYSAVSCFGGYNQWQIGLLHTKETPDNDQHIAVPWQQGSCGPYVGPHENCYLGTVLSHGGLVMPYAIKLMVNISAGNDLATNRCQVIIKTGGDLFEPQFNHYPSMLFCSGLNILMHYLIR